MKKRINIFDYIKKNGCYTFNELEFNVVDKFLFEKKQIEILEKIQQKQIIEEELELIERINKSGSL